MGNPVLDFLQFADEPSFEKVANPVPAPGVLRGLGIHGGNALAQGLGAGVGAALLAGGAVAAQHIYNAATAKRDFRGMMEWNQDLQHEDQRMVNQSFRTLRRFAPDMSKDPLVAGSMIRQMVQAPQGAAGIMQQAMNGQGSLPTPITEAYMRASSGGVSTGVKDMNPFGANPGFMRTSDHDRQMRDHADDFASRQRQGDMAYSGLAAKYDAHVTQYQEALRQHQEALQQKEEEAGRARRSGYEAGARAGRTQVAAAGSPQGKGQLPLPGFTSDGRQILGVRRK